MSDGDNKMMPAPGRRFTVRTIVGIVFFDIYHINTILMQKFTSGFSGLLTLMLTMLTTALHAQADINVDIRKGGSDSTWYTNPIVWIVGAAIFILLLAAILRRK
jgi:hypothetical protein